MASPIVALRDIEFSWPQAADPLFNNLSATLTVGFTGVVGVNGAGKSTLLKLLGGEIHPDAGHIEGNSDLVFCDQRTDDPPDRLDEFLSDWDAQAYELRARLAIADDSHERWLNLSHGERKRVQIGCALWQRPEVLVLDEPANHIDADARAMLRNALARYRGIGVLVSHDRDLLDALCTQVIWLSPPTATVFPGNYTQAREEHDRQTLFAQRNRDNLRAEQKALDAEVAKRRAQANGADAKRSKRGISAKDSDARDRINRAKLTGKDGTAGKLLRQIEGRAAQGAQALADTSVQKEYASGIWLSGEAARADTLWTLPAGELALGDERVLEHPRLTMKPTDRIAITGPNGSGKSTLVAAIRQQISLPAERLVVMPQELDVNQATALLNEVRALPKAQLGQVMSIVSRLGSRPERLLDSHLPSPGEVRKLMLALGIARSPFLLILDEPTNHLDVLAIESLQEALMACPCGLLLVSHDEQLLDALGVERWEISEGRLRHE